MQKSSLARLFWSLVLVPTVSSPQWGLLLIASAIASAQKAAATPDRQTHLTAAAQLRRWEFDPYTNKLQLSLPEGITPEYFILQQPPRIAIDIPTRHRGFDPSEENYPGIVRQIRVGHLEGGVTRVVMEFAPGTRLEPTQVKLEPIGQGNWWVLQPAVNLAETLPNVENASNTAARGDTLPALPISAANESVPVNVAPPPPPPTLEIGETSGEDLSGATVRVPPPPGEEEAVSLNVPPPEQNLELELSEFELPTEGVRGGDRTPSVSVPPLENPEAQENEPLPVPEEPVSGEARATARDRETERPPHEAIAASVVSAPVIEFGQPLPPTGSNLTAAATVAPPELPPTEEATQTQGTAAETEETAANIARDVMLSAGSVVVLSYPGSAPLTLEDKSSRQEVLLVYSDLYDRSGKLIAPVGTPAIGRFVSDGDGIRYRTEALILDGRAIPFVAESDLIQGTRNINEGRTLSYSAVGAVAGAVLGGLAGGPLLGGAAAGAATSFLSSGKSATIEPGHVFPVRLREHWP